MSASLQLTPVPVENAPMKWSASRLKMLLQCPRKFRFTYIDRVPQVVTAPLVFGKTMHRVVCEAHEEQMRGGTFPPLIEMLELFDGLWSEALTREKPFFRDTGPTSQAYATSGREMLRLFYKTQEGRIPLTVELPFEIEWEGYILRGLIDRVDEVRSKEGESALVVVDYKSGARKPSAGEARSDLQLTIYALVIQQMLGLPVERVEFHFLKSGTAIEALHYEESSKSLLRSALAYADVVAERDEYPACPGYWCRWCDYKVQCQAEGIATGRMEDDSVYLEVIPGARRR
jgi:putative RecB family exonuclease